jgi:hypothetical protein
VKVFLVKYLEVEWIHNFPDEPILLYSELDDSRFETRKVEVFRDGKRGYASKTESSGTTVLGIVAVPDIDVIAKDSQFIVKEIQRGLFEQVWIESVQVNKGRN